MTYSVYAIEEESSGRVKVGYCRTDRLRPVSGNTLSDLQLGNPDELYLAWSRDTYRTKPDAKAAETFAHDELKKARGRLHIRGEWYKPEALDMLPGILDDYAKQ